MTLYNKILWSNAQLEFMADNHRTMTNQAMADALGLKLTSVRTKLYEMGLYKMRLEYWTDEQVQFLKANFTQLGDTELAEIFNTKWHKDKGWSKKHIEKKRRYLMLKRTPGEIASIHSRNVALGCFSMCAVNAWKQRGVSPDGTIRFWRTTETDRLVPHIKINGRYVHWNRWFWEQNVGPIPSDHYIIFKGDTSILTLDNLRIIPLSEYKKEFNTREVVNLSDSYVASMLSIKDPTLRNVVADIPELIKAKRTQLLINRKIKEHGTKQNRRS